MNDPDPPQESSLPNEDSTPQPPVPPAGPLRLQRVSVRSRLAEFRPAPVVIPRKTLKSAARRDFLLFGAGALLAAAGFWWLLPEETQQRPFSEPSRAWLDSLEARTGASREGLTSARERLLNGALTFDDDVAEALYSPGRTVPTYDRSRITDLRNNYDGQTPDPGYIPDWRLTVAGTTSPLSLSLHDIHGMIERYGFHEQVTRLVCVEGWSAIAWWGGLRFADLLNAYPPHPDARWAALDSSVNLDGDGNPDPYYVSIDLPTARHPQTLLATHFNGKPLTVEHGAPLRLVAPMKLGLKNIKAITRITYTASEPADYWNRQGYSKYDGI